MKMIKIMDLEPILYLLTALGKTLSDNGSIMAANLVGNQVVMD